MRKHDNDQVLKEKPGKTGARAGKRAEPNPVALDADGEEQTGKAEAPFGTQSLLRGLQIMETLSNFPNGCPLAKLVELCGMNKSTTHRLLQGLQSAGYVTNAPTPGSYRLTTKCVAVGEKALSSLNIIHVAAHHLEALNIETGETVNLSFREGDHAILIYKLESTIGMIRTRAYIGQHLPMYCSGMGKIFLAYDHPAHVARYWHEQQGNIVPLTPSTITDEQAMLDELAEIRKQGYALDREENGLGMWCIAAPIFNIRQQVEYAVSVAVSTAGLSQARKAELIERVRQTAEQITRELAG